MYGPPLAEDSNCSYCYSFPFQGLLLFFHVHLCMYMYVPLKRLEMGARN